MKWTDGFVEILVSMADLICIFFLYFISGYSIQAPFEFLWELLNLNSDGMRI